MERWIALVTPCFSIILVFMTLLSTPDAPLGIFDSGIGGLTVFKAVRERLPFEDIIYLGDTARVPYGTKSRETVTKYSTRNTLFLMEMGVKMVIVACNTASSLSFEPISKLCSDKGIPVIGVIEPGIRLALHHSQGLRIGVIGTEATVSGSAYLKGIMERASSARVFMLSCPLFVPLVEEGWIDDEITEMVARRYLNHFADLKIDTLILGCTHYPLLKGVLKRVLGEGVELIDSAEAVAIEVENSLSKMGLLKKCDQKGGSQKGSNRFFVTDSPDRFRKVGEMFLGDRIDMLSVELIDIGEGE